MLFISFRSKLKKKLRKVKDEKCLFELDYWKFYSLKLLSTKLNCIKICNCMKILQIQKNCKTLKSKKMLMLETACFNKTYWSVIIDLHMKFEVRQAWLPKIKFNKLK